ncbi:MAG: hypothetical protein SCK70_03740, partial [bacterium]|nr:hypothetical protein [bacterium]
MGEKFIKQKGSEQSIKEYFEQYVSGNLLTLIQNAGNPSLLDGKKNNAQKPETCNFLNPKDKNKIFWNCEIKFPKPLDDRPTISGVNKDILYVLGMFLDLHKGIKEHQLKALLDDGFRAIEVLQYSHDLASGEEKEIQNTAKIAQSESSTWIASPYGFERLMLNSSDNFLDQKRGQLLKFLRKLNLQNGLAASGYREFYELAKLLLVDALGDTQIPINDVTLWDLSHSTASFFKSAVAGLVCSGKTKNQLQPGFHKDLKWRYLSISVDFHKFVTSSQKIIDMVHRKDYLIHVYDEIKNLLEVEYPLANEVYRDENGPVFLVPEAEDDLLCWTDVDKTTLEEKINNCFRKSYSERNEEENAFIKIIEALPHIHISKEVFAGEKKGTLQHALKKRKPGFSADPALLAEIWSFDSVKKAHPEVCPVCRLRPVGFDENGNPDDKAKERKICAVCLGRRSGRAKNWYAFGLKQTIWIEETADENGRAALLCGDFNIDHWLDGTFIETTFQKNPSFARIRRCWETTNQFWQEVLDKLVKGVGQPSKRIFIKPSKPLTTLNKFQAYELKIKDIYLNAIWLGDRFIGTDNLIAFCRRLAPLMRRKRLDKSISSEKTIDLLKELLAEARSVEIFEPPHYSQGRSKEPMDNFEIRSEGIEDDRDDYFPFISILHSPTRFYCIVPASDAFTIARLIRQKYQEEMGKVRDRLSLKLGIVYFQKYVPAAAVLDAGNRLLAYPQNDEIYQIEQVNAD